MKVRIYSSGSAFSSPWAYLGEMWSDLMEGRELAWQLAVRDIKAMYRQSFLGILWAFFVPLASTITWIFLKGSGIIALDNTSIPYPVFVFTGTLLWSVFMDSLNAPLNLVLASRNLISKINFPHESIFLSGIYQTLFNSVIKVVLMLAAMMVMGVFPGWSLLLFPLALLSLLLAGMTLGLLITPIGVLYSDIGRAISLGMQFVMFVTPVVFPIPKSGWVSLLVQYNPLTPIMMTARNWLTDTPVEFLPEFLVINALLIVLLLIGWGVIRLTLPILVERMSN